MTEEEKQAIEDIDKRLTIEKYTKNIGTPVNISALKTVLNLIQKQQKEIERLKNLNRHQSKDIKKAVDYTFELNAELEKKDKIIDETTELFVDEGFYSEYCQTDSDMCINDCDKCIKQYFEKKVEENNGKNI